MPVVNGDAGEDPEAVEVGRRQQRDEGHAGQLDEGDDEQDDALGHPVGHHAGDQRRQEDPTPRRPPW